MKSKYIFLFLVCFSLLLVIRMSAEALVWDFKTDSESKDWTAIRAEWKIDTKQGVFIGSSDVDEGTAVVSKDIWDDKWVNYTLEAKVRNMGSENHFGIGFRDDGAGNHYGFYMNDVVTGESKYYFGTFVNGTYTGLAGNWAEDGNYKDAEDWNVMKVVVKDFTFDLYINDKLLINVTDNAKTFKNGPIALVSDKNVKTAIAQFDYVKVEGEGIPMAVYPAGKLATTWATTKAQY
jgi:hypothetical protein